MGCGAPNTRLKLTARRLWNESFFSAPQLKCDPSRGADRVPPHPGASVSAAILYRVGAVLLLLFAIGHQLGFRQVEPQWGVAAYIDGLKSTTFEVQGARRNYWDFFSGLGFFVTVLLLFSAVLAWQLAGMPVTTLASLRLVLWSFAACYVLIALLSWRYFFAAPLVLSALVA